MSVNKSIIIFSYVISFFMPLKSYSSILTETFIVQLKILIVTNTETYDLAGDLYIIVLPHNSHYNNCHIYCVRGVYIAQVDDNIIIV